MEMRILEELGLSNAEAKVYVALLELGPSKTGRIIDKSKLQSSTVYHILGSLIEKGLVSYIMKGKQKHFQAGKPETFLNYLDEKKKKFQGVLPQLKQLEAAAKRKMSAEIYEGVRGMKAAFDDVISTLKSGDTYYFYSAPSENLIADRDGFIRFFRSHHLKRQEKGIKARGLSTPQNKKLLSGVVKGIKNCKIHYLKDFAPTGLVVYANKLITWEWTEAPIVVVIENAPIAKSYKEFFERMWENASS